jgi:hypothetical protein
MHAAARPTQTLIVRHRPAIHGDDESRRVNWRSSRPADCTSSTIDGSANDPPQIAIEIRVHTCLLSLRLTKWSKYGLFHGLAPVPERFARNRDISMKGFPHSTKKLSSRRSRLLFSFRAFLRPCTGPGWPLGGPYIHLSWQARSTSFDLRHMISSGAGGPITSLASQASIASGL